MLSSMRISKKNQPFVYGLLGLLALGLVGVASGGVDGSRISSIGKVGEEPIPVTSYAQSLRNTVQSISRQIGRQITSQEVSAYGLQAEALENVVSSAALSNEANRLTISVGDDLVAEEIVATPTFTSVDGKFNKEAYEFALENSGLNTKEYELQTRKAIARSLIEGAVATGTKSPSSHAMTLIKYAREERSFDWTSINKTFLSKLANDPTSEELIKFYDNNHALYTTPLTREITYVLLSPDMLSKKIEIPKNSIKEEYDSQPDRFNKPARRIVDRIIFDTLETAKKVKNQIAQEEITFNEVAEKRGLTQTDIDLGDIEEGQLDADINKLLFNAENVGIYGPIETSLGQALFRINAIIEPQNTSLEDAKAELTAEYVSIESRKLINEMISDIDDLLAQGLTIEEIAKDTDMEVGKISYNDNYEEGIAAYDGFRAEASNSKIGDFPELKELSDGGIFALRLDKIIEPTLSPFEKVKNQVIDNWSDAENKKSLLKLGDELVIKLDNGNTFESLSLPLNSVNSVKRNKFIDNIPGTLLEQLFLNEVGKTSKIDNGDTVILARLNSITQFDAKSDENKELLSQVGFQLSNQVTGDLLRLFASALKDRDGVTLNQNAVNQINTQILGGTGF
ncbi:SurA N-terminal domain-containing protein [Amylibacter sp.]|nr:SurA N-terminal domain-containing protein [Amylibacter sp.]